MGDVGQLAPYLKSESCFRIRKWEHIAVPQVIKTNKIHNSQQLNTPILYFIGGHVIPKLLYQYPLFRLQTFFQILNSWILTPFSHKSISED